MKISQRLYLAVAPAIVGVLLMAALFYWGRYEQTAPRIVLVVGGIAVIASLFLVWSNARVVARRIEQLASAASPGTDQSGPDELQRIALGLNRLSTDVQTAEADRADRERVLEERMRDYATLLANIAENTAKRLEEVRLPLHILLENHFGDLNENQEEMLGAARGAAEAADADLVNLRQIAELDLGELALRRDRMKPSEIVEALRPMLVAAAESVGAAIELTVGPLIPAILGDRARLQDALATLLGDAVRSSAAGARVQMNVEQRGKLLVVELRGIGVVSPSVRSAVAARVLDAHRGAVERRPGEMTITLPIDSKGSLSQRTSGLGASGKP